MASQRPYLPGLAMSTSLAELKEFLAGGDNVKEEKLAGARFQGLIRVILAEHGFSVPEAAANSWRLCLELGVRPPPKNPL